MPGFVMPDRLRQMIETGDDTSFLVVDVRPRDQYGLDHIPGAVNIPLNEIESHTTFFKRDTDVVFCCRNGVRSKVAAILAVDGGLAPERAFTLEGGMAAYTGDVLLELPRLSLFEDMTDPGDVAAAALAFEKGAWRFYSRASKSGPTRAMCRFFEQMARLETDHARALFDRLDPKQRKDLSFDAYFDLCEGEILEGGRSLDEAFSLLAGHSNGRADDETDDKANDEDLLDLALEIETAAYDLYKQKGAGFAMDTDLSFFLKLAGDEKKHMAMIADFISRSFADPSEKN